MFRKSPKQDKKKKKNRCLRVLNNTVEIFPTTCMELKLQGLNESDILFYGRYPSVLLFLQS